MFWERLTPKNLKEIRAVVQFVLIGFLGAMFGVFALGFFLASDIYDYQDTVDGVHLPVVDSLVCLAGGRGRIAGAGDIWYRYREAADGKLPVFYVSGMGPQSTFSGFRKSLRTGVRDIIRPEQVVLEIESTNTESNARLLSRHAIAQGWSRILLVTSPYHMKRARFMFERVAASLGRPLEIETFSIYQEPFEPGEWRYNVHGIRVTMTEYFKWIYYRYFWNP